MRKHETMRVVGGTLSKYVNICIMHTYMIIYYIHVCVSMYLCILCIYVYMYVYIYNYIYNVCVCIIRVSYVTFTVAI